MISDYLLNKGIDDFTHLISRHSKKPVFYYEYAHLGQSTLSQLMGFTPEMVRPLGNNDYNVCTIYSKKSNYIHFICKGVGHGDELLSQFTNSMSPLLSDPKDKKASQLVLDLWTSFATDGYYHLSSFVYYSFLIDFVNIY